MNALRILLSLALIIYFLFYEPYFIVYYLGFVLVYYIISELSYRSRRITNSKLNFFMSFWNYPYDPQIYARIKVNLTESIKKLEVLSKKHGVELTLMALIAKIKGNILAAHKLAHTSIIFGKIIPRTTCDVSIFTSFGDASESELITIKECDKKSIVDIQHEINKLKKDLDEGKHEAHNRRSMFSKLVPSL